MAHKKVKAFFHFEDEARVSSRRMVCDLCGRTYDPHGIILQIYDNKMLSGGWYSCVCGGCFTTDTKALADSFRKRASILQATKPRRGDDRDTNIKWAKAMLSVANDLERVDFVKELDGGVMAVKVWEAYQEIEKPRPQRTRKAA